MIAGHVAMRDVWPDESTWHLVDAGSWPLMTRCGQPAPAPMARQVKAARHLAVDDACSDCLDAMAAAAQAGRQRRLRGA